MFCSQPSSGQLKLINRVCLSGEDLHCAVETYKSPLERHLSGLRSEPVSEARLEERIVIRLGKRSERSRPVRYLVQRWPVLHFTAHFARRKVRREEGAKNAGRTGRGGSFIGGETISIKCFTVMNETTYPIRANNRSLTGRRENGKASRSQ